MTKKIFLFFLFLSFSAEAAQLGQVDAEETWLVRTPSRTAESIESIPQGSYVVISNYPIEGFYKARTQNGTIGFVSTRDVSVVKDPQVIRKKLRKKSISPSDRFDDQTIQFQEKLPEPIVNPGKIHFSLLYGMSLYSWSAFSDATGVQKFNSGYHFGLEVHFPMSDRWTVGLRVEKIFKNLNYQHTDSNRYTLSSSSIPMMVGGSYLLVKKEFLLSAGLFLGVGFNTNFSSESLANSTNSTTFYEGLAMSGLLKVEFAYPLSQTFFVFLEAGYRYLATSDLSATQEGSGSDFLQSSGSFMSLPINFSGFVVSAGLSLYL